MCKNKKRTKEFYKKEYEKYKEYFKFYYEKNKDQIREREKIYRDNNKDKIKERGEKYRGKNKEKFKYNSEKYYERKDVISKTARKYRENNIERSLYKNALYRAKKYNLPIDISIEDIKSVMINICPLLQIPLKVNFKYSKDDSYSLDRIDITKGYVKNNIQVISYKANSSKNMLTITEYEKIVNNLYKITNGKKLIKCGIDNYNKYITPYNIFNMARRRCKRNNIPININVDYIASVYPANNKCPLLDIELIKSKKAISKNSPTLDRIIPSLGYIEGNVMFISNKANLAKRNLSLDEMKILLNNWKKI